MLRLAFLVLTALLLLSAQGLVAPSCAPQGTHSLDTCREAPGETPADGSDDLVDSDPILLYPSPAEVHPFVAAHTLVRAAALRFKPVSLTPPHQPPRVS